MSDELRGSLVGSGLKIGIVAARFNDAIVDRLISGAVDGLVRHSVKEKDINVVRCPGAWELPLVCQRMAKAGSYDALIALGCVIRGDTAHFDYVAGQACSGIARVALDSEIPVIFGVLTTETVEQAMDRAGIKLGNKGYESAEAAIEMINVLKEIK